MRFQFAYQLRLKSSVVEQSRFYEIKFGKYEGAQSACFVIQDKIGARSNTFHPPTTDRVNHGKMFKYFFPVVDFDSDMLHYYRHNMNLAISQEKLCVLFKIVY